MIDGTVTIAFVMMIYLGVAFRYVWIAKHPGLSIWNALARVFLIVCGTPLIVFATAYITSMLMFSLLGDAAVSNSISRVVIGAVAMFPLLPAIFLVRRMIKTPPRGFEGALSEQALA